MKNIFPIILILFIGFMTGVYYKDFISQEKSLIKESDGCKVVEVKMKTTKYIRFCKDNLVLTDTKDAKKGKLLESETIFPELFYYQMKGDPERSYVSENLKEVVAFPKNNPRFIAVKSVIDWTSWYVSVLEVFKIEGDTLIPAGKVAFNDALGRWVDIGVLQDRPGYFIKGDYVVLGCLGCRAPWVDFFVWDGKENTFVLDNASHKEEFKKLRAELDELDKTSCAVEQPSMDGKRISELYQSRKDHDKFCSDDSEVPYISNGEARLFLEGIDTVDKIINGENLGREDIGDI